MQKCIQTIPTIGYNVEKVAYKNHEFTFFDLAGIPNLRTLWGNYLKKSDCIIFVIDSHDQQKLEEAKAALNEVLAIAKNKPVLVLANKQDYENALTCDNLKTSLGLHQHQHQTHIHVQGCVAKTGQGLDDSMEWISTHVH